MGLKRLLERNKAAVVKKWFDRVIETYPADTMHFLKSQKDSFANPVGRTIYRGLEALLDQLLKEMDYQALTSCLDPVIRIRAVQNFSPSQAVGFVFSLKSVIRTNLHHELVEKEIEDELLLLESRIDELGLLAFNIYMQCREKIYELKANEMRNRTFKAFKRAGLVKELPEVEPELEPIINFRQEALNDT